MSRYRNLIMMFVALLMLIYVGIMTVYPLVLTSMFKKEAFEEKLYTATGLISSVDNVEYVMKPNLDMDIILKNWSSKYIDNQDCFDARTIKIKTGFLSPLTKNFSVKDMSLKHVTFTNQILPDGKNKLEYLPRSFEAEPFGKDEIKISAAPIEIYDFKIKNISSDSYNEENREKVKYSKEEVKDFLDGLKIRFVQVI